MLRELAEGRGRGRGQLEDKRGEGGREGDKKEGSEADLTNGGKRRRVGKEATKEERRRKTMNDYKK